MFCNPIISMISRDELQQRMLDSARNVFSVVADINLEECHERPDGHYEDWVTALVSFEGSYNGLVALHCPEPLARRTTATLLCAGKDVNLQDVFVAMGEVVNILGGDMKLYLDRGGRQVRLSEPLVFVRDRDSHDMLLSVPETIVCTMAAGDERLMIGVQVSRGDCPSVDRRGKRDRRGQYTNSGTISQISDEREGS
jgi:chemotaxis protein CheX